MPDDLSTHQSVDETARRRFEAAWRAGRPAVEEHLPPGNDPRFLPTLEELVLIDLTMAWKPGAADPRPVVEDYVARFPALNDRAVLLRLLREEYRTRHAHGDRPPAADYVRRFPGLVAAPEDVETAAPPAAAPGGVPDVPGYELLGELGRGGMGVVYRARQTGLDRIVALKMIRGPADAHDLARFRTEAEAVARLRHPNVVQVYDVGTAGGLPYLALEFVPGGGLDRAIAATPQPPELAARVVERLARGVHAAHQAGVLHRDLKPANVLLDPDGERGTLPWVPKVADFGLAKRLDADAGHTGTGLVLGTPSYMAPEQAAGRADVGPAADVYALGAVLYELLAGRPPFRAATAWETIDQVLHAEPVPPSRLAARVPRDLETVCLACLHKDPTRRYPTADALADDLTRFLAGEPVRARPVGRWERAAKWVRRRPAAAALIVATLVAVLASAGGAVALAFNGRLQEALTLAEERRGEAVAGKAEADEQRRVANEQRGIAEGQRGIAEGQRAEADVQRSLARRFQYLAQMNLAQRAWDDGDAPRALDLLGLHAAPAGDDPRGFEWHYLRRAARLVATRDGFTAGVKDLAFSRERGRLAAVAFDGSVVVWDAAGRPLFRGRGTTWGLGVALDRDGGRVAAAVGPGVRVWDVDAGTPLHTLAVTGGRVGGVAYSPDGAKLAAAGFGGTVTVWDARSGKQLATPLVRPRRSVNRVAFSPDGTRLAWVADAEKNGELTVWNLAADRPDYTATDLPGGGRDVAVAADGCVTALGDDGTVKVWDAAGKPLRTVTGLPDGTRSIALSPDGTRLAATGGDFMVRVLDAAGGRPPVELKGHTRTPSRDQFGLAGSVNRAAFSADGRRLASGGDDRRVLVWDVEPSAVEPTFPIAGAVTLPDRSWGAVRDKDAVRVYDAAGRETRELTSPAGRPRSQWIAASGRLLVVSYGQFVREAVVVWDPAAGRALLTIHPERDATVAVSPDGRRVAAGSGKVRVWDTTTGESVETAEGHSFRIGVLTFSPNSTRLASAGEDATARVWDVATGRRLHVLRGHTSTVRDATWSADGRLLATAGQDDTVRVWDADGRPVHALRAHPGGAWAVAFTPDGSRLASGGEDATVRVWDVRAGHEVLALRGHAAPVTSVRFGDVGGTLTSRSSDGVQRTWDARPRPD